MRVFFFIYEFAALKMLRNAGAARSSDRKPELIIRGREPKLTS
jgi:hypothetical protein